MTKLEMWRQNDGRSIWPQWNSAQQTGAQTYWDIPIGAWIPDLLFHTTRTYE